MNPFPPNYANSISPENLPPELQSLSVECWLPATATQEPPAPVFLFVVDLICDKPDLEALKSNLQRVVMSLPERARVGLISFGNMTFVHELGFKECPRSIVFKGAKVLTPEQILQQLNIPQRTDPRGAMSISPAAERFFARADEMELEINNVIEHLRVDSWDVARGNRPTRCTGTALSVAQALMEGCAAGCPGRLMLFTAGPCTSGPGLIVELPRKEILRSHHDIQTESTNARHLKKSITFYSELARRMVKANHAFDLFAAALDQVGLYEMRVMSDRTGGTMVMTDSFSQHVFDKSLTKLFSADAYGSLMMGFKAKLDVVTSKDVKICGVVGACASTGKAGANVSNTVKVGEASTNEWVFGALDASSSVALYIETTNETNTAPGEMGYIQMRTHFTHASGQKRIRITTIGCQYADPDNVRSHMIRGFDQEAAVSLMARYAVFKSESSDAVDVLRWLDRTLIRLVAHFADYEKDAPDSLMLPAEFVYYPKFMYHLRRSRFLHTFGASPDETAWHRGVLCRENVLNSVIMIQPTLLSYSASSSAPVPVNLDASSMQKDVLLLMDTFFEVVTWKGPTVLSWINQNYHTQEGFEHIKAMIEAPNTDATALVDSRFPAPRFITAFAGGSQERFLTAVVNPSRSHKSSSDGSGQVGSVGETGVVLTEDVSFEGFYAYLKKLAVNGSR